MLLVFSLSTAFAASNPPQPTVTVEGKIIPTVRGSFCWPLVPSGDPLCVDVSSPMDIVKDQIPVVVPRGSKAAIQFEEKPQKLIVSQWIGGKPVTQPFMEDNTIALPRKAGVYLYEIDAGWKDGGASYAFVIEVRE